MLYLEHVARLSRVVWDTVELTIFVLTIDFETDPSMFANVHVTWYLVVGPFALSRDIGFQDTIKVDESILDADNNCGDPFGTVKENKKYIYHFRFLKQTLTDTKIITIIKEIIHITAFLAVHKWYIQFLGCNHSQENVTTKTWRLCWYHKLRSY
jgi:hypothetical protein